MNSALYLPRRLTSNGRNYTEEELLSYSNYVVVLAEPGGGKTEFLASIARRLGVSVVTANVFRHLGTQERQSPLIIDAFDELAKIDPSGIHSLLAAATRSNPTHLIISSRSSEWDSAATSAFTAFLGIQPLIVTLNEFKETEQRTIFENHVQGEDFAAFQEEVARFDLDSLLPNPQFLKLFADAYVESNRIFADKRSIFSLAVDRLAKEVNSSVRRHNSGLSIARKVSLSSEIFAKLLLSGADGISTTEVSETRLYPLLASLLRTDSGSNGILATRLFKPGDAPDHHRHVHKMALLHKPGLDQRGTCWSGSLNG